MRPAKLYLSANCYRKEYRVPRSEQPINNSPRDFLLNVGHKISLQSGDDRQASFLFQPLSILIQRFNAILLHDSFVREED